MIWQQTVPTVRDTLAGFALAALFGVGLASLLSFSRLLRDAIYPLIVVIQLVPKIAWTPLFIVWVGIGWQSRLTIAAFIGFFPIFIAMMAGLESTDRSLVRLCRGLTATPWRTFWLVRLPASMPYLFAGLKIAITLAVIGVIVAEFISSSEGLGFLILKSAALLRTDIILAAITVLCVIGLACYGAVHAGELAIRKWQGE
jgi:NitT/TauT family transport system permease protein